jgi:subtilisin family serine protease
MVVCAVAAFAGDGTIRKSLRPIPNEYRIRLVETLTPEQVRALAKGLAMQHDGKLGAVFENVVPGFAVMLSEAQAAAMSRHPLVEAVEEASEVYMSQVQLNAPWHLDRIDQRTLPLNGTYNRYCETTRVHAYVLDTGIKATHQEFMYEGVSRVIAGKDFIQPASTGATNPCPGVTYYDDSSNPCASSDRFCGNGGHGTAVASVLAGQTYGVARHVKLISVRVRGCGANGGISSTIVEQGLNWIYNDHATRLRSDGLPYPAVLNMSFELAVVQGSALTSLELAVNKLVNERNIVAVAAAGNRNVSVVHASPARLSRSLGGRVITAGGSTNTDRRWRCNPANLWEADACPSGTIVASNYGGLDIFAPSQNVPSAGIKQLEAGTNKCCVDSTTAERQVARSGTSFAAPIVAGIAAIHLTQDPTRTPDQVWDLIRTQASGDTGGSTPPAVMNPTSNDANTLSLSGSPNRLLFRQGVTRCMMGF